jgi:hypothetical protein
MQWKDYSIVCGDEATVGKTNCIGMVVTWNMGNDWACIQFLLEPTQSEILGIRYLHGCYGEVHIACAKDIHVFHFIMQRQRHAALLSTCDYIGSHHSVYL